MIYIFLVLNIVFFLLIQVTGIEGTYMRTCESVMTVLHRNKDSLMAVLEAFVYDPLLNWRLIESTTATSKGKRGKSQPQPDSSHSSQEPGDILDSIPNNMMPTLSSKPGVPESVENIGWYFFSIC
jgi:FKBP12-rapamycin complex-associated protein